MSQGLYKLFIDDERDPPAGGSSWVVARSSSEAIQIVKECGCPAFISYDHDLGGDDTSIRFLHWYLEYLSGMIVPTFPRTALGVCNTIRSFYAHTQNPVGKANIEGMINSFINFITKEYHLGQAT